LLAVWAGEGERHVNPLLFRRDAQELSGREFQPVDVRLAAGDLAFDRLARLEGGDFLTSGCLQDEAQDKGESVKLLDHENPPTYLDRNSAVNPLNASATKKLLPYGRLAIRRGKRRRHFYFYSNGGGYYRQRNRM
jgi:hypothetical protein